MQVISVRCFFVLLLGLLPSTLLRLVCVLPLSLCLFAVSASVDPRPGAFSSLCLNVIFLFLSCLLFLCVSVPLLISCSFRPARLLRVLFLSIVFCLVFLYVCCVSPTRCEPSHRAYLVSGPHLVRIDGGRGTHTYMHTTCRHTRIRCIQTDKQTDKRTSIHTLVVHPTASS